MRPNIGRVRELMSERKWSSSELARQMGVSRSEVTKLMKGSRTGGSKVISGLIKAFPNEPYETLFFLPHVYPNVNITHKTVTDRKPSGKHHLISVKHPDAHQLACTVDEDFGLVEIKQGKCITTLVIPPGHVSINYTKTE